MKTSGLTTGTRQRPLVNISSLARAMGWSLLFFFVLLFFTPIFFSPMPGGILKIPESSRVQAAHIIGLALFSYANDNNQLYPSAASSTEAFQKLLDGGYIADPTVFYLPMPGKVKPVAGQKLKPENVCWDLTAPVDIVTANGLPVVFLTGYKIHYVPGGAAVPMIKPAPIYGFETAPRTWFERTFGGHEIHYEASNGFTAFFGNNSAMFIRASADGTIPRAVSPDFISDGTTYYQLTPDGALR